MKQFILIDENNICRCIATEPENLHKDKIDAGMKTYRLNQPVRIGDEVIPGKEILKDVVIAFEKVEVEPATEDKDAVLESRPVTEKQLDYHKAIVTPRPENYPVHEPTRAELIQAKALEMAEAALIAEGVIA